MTPKTWRDYETFLERADASGGGSAYICVYAHRQGTHARSRFAIRLDLPGTYRTRQDAEAAASEVARRFFRGQLSPPRAELSLDVKHYRLAASGKFRADTHQWEPSLRIINRQTGKIQRHDVEELESPFYSNTFTSCEGAARFAISFGERAWCVASSEVYGFDAARYP